MQINKIIKKIRSNYIYYIRHRSNCVSYFRSKGMVIGGDCSILAGRACVQSAEPYLIRIGNNVTFAKGVELITHDGGTRVFRKNHSKWEPGMGIYGPIEIGDNVFVGVNSIILPNVTIGSNVVIGAGSVVTKNIPSNVIVAGNPAKIINSIDEYIDRVFEKVKKVRVDLPQNKKEDLINIYWR